jgi:hypothetical protein
LESRGKNHRIAPSELQLYILLQLTVGANQLDVCVDFVVCPPPPRIPPHRWRGHTLYLRLAHESFRLGQQGRGCGPPCKHTWPMASAKCT